MTRTCARGHIVEDDSLERCPVCRIFLPGNSTRVVGGVAVNVAALDNRARELVEGEGLQWDEIPESLRQIATKAAKKTGSASDMTLFLKQAGSLKPVPRSGAEPAQDVTEIVLTAETVEGLARTIATMKALLHE